MNELYNQSLTYHQRAIKFVSNLTLEEKQSQYCNLMDELPRFDLEPFFIWNEAAHGVVDAYPTTSFPASVAMGATWNPKLMYFVSKAISDEARALKNLKNKQVFYFSPVVEPIKDQRWGRNAESFSEDPVLSAEMGAAFVKGMIGNDKHFKTISTLKHFFANNSEIDRHTGSANISPKEIREYYIYPYEKIIKNYPLPSIMTSYNAVNGVPSSASRYYLNTVLRKQFGFKGYVVSDADAVRDMYLNHHYVDNEFEAVATALKAGVDVENGNYGKCFVKEAIEKGLVDESYLDQALVNIFETRLKTGEFDTGFDLENSYYNANIIESQEHLFLAEQAASEAIVLLKNDCLLPLDASKKQTVALIGPQSNYCELGGYSGSPSEEYRVSPLQGFEKYLNNYNDCQVELVQDIGAKVGNPNDLFKLHWFKITNDINESSKYFARDVSEVSADRIQTSLFPPDETYRLMHMNDGDWVKFHNVDLTGAKLIEFDIMALDNDGGVVEVHSDTPDGNLLAEIIVPPTPLPAPPDETTHSSGANLENPFANIKTITANINQFGDKGEHDVYLVFRSKEIDDVREQAVNMAKMSDIAIVFVGTNEKTAGEERDLESLDLPGAQLKLIKEIQKVNDNVVVVIQSMSGMNIESILPDSKACLWSGYNGERQGDALAKIIFGDINPSGHLNFTWYKDDKVLPHISEYSLTKKGAERTYWYDQDQPLFEFGYGLSYSEFQYSNYVLNKHIVGNQDKLIIEFDAENVSNQDAMQVFQVYVKFKNSDNHPSKLKSFSKILLPANQTSHCYLTLDTNELWVWNEKKECKEWPVGDYEVMLATSCSNILNTWTVQLVDIAGTRVERVNIDQDKLILSVHDKLELVPSITFNDDSILYPSVKDYDYKNICNGDIIFDEVTNAIIIEPKASGFISGEISYGQCSVTFDALVI